MSSARDVAAVIGNACGDGRNWPCSCPLHGSHGAVPGLRDGNDGIVVKCHAGCPLGDVVGELRRQELIDADRNTSNQRPDLVAIRRRGEAEEYEERPPLIRATSCRRGRAEKPQQ